MNVNYKKYRIITLCSLIYFASYFTRKDFAAAMAGMIESGDILKDVAGLVGTALFICYGAGQIISGILGDRISPSRMIIFGLGASAVCNFLLPFSAGSYFTVVIWAINGFAQAMLWPPIVKILSSCLDNETFVKANMVVTIAAHAATILLYLYVPLCLQYMTWKAVFFSGTILAAAVLVVFIFSLSIILPSERVHTVKTKESSVNGTKNETGFFRIAISAGIIPIFFAVLLQGFLRDGIDTWIPTLYAEVFGKTAAESVLVSGLIPVFSIIGVTISTSAHKKLMKNEVLGSVIFFSIAAALCVPLFFAIQTSSVFSRICVLYLMAGISSMSHGINFLLISCLPGRFAEYGKAATASGFCNAFTYIGSAIASYGLAKVDSWYDSVIIWGIAAFLGIVLCLTVFKKYAKQLKIQ